MQLKKIFVEISNFFLLNMNYTDHLNYKMFLSVLPDTKTKIKIVIYFGLIDLLQNVLLSQFHHTITVTEIVYRKN